ncbi:hypothetical protein E1A91_D04G163800v1 [Gossypium mustelinum]|uniref:Exocyst subunit Exo70 family protein n=3 Tax=Gossypium TaxID=3633 RepID=A0ABM2ZZP8_GOSHI|nr:exocyst complex component EXO70B1-like [Gossypium hirsutum]TYH77705.1 hypothetical protein ES332_D04G173000v1 [Gossypium tomentosum]TYI87835.1 hypothetical protein E1A91_D04G163800v1 [Gossypium mustelinum]
MEKDDSFILEIVDENEKASKPAGFNLDQTLEEVDQFIQKLVPGENKFVKCIDPLQELVDSRIALYEQKEPAAKFGLNIDEDNSFFEAVRRLSLIVNNLDEFPSDLAAISCLNRASSAHFRAMLLFECELRALLDNPKRTGDPNFDPKSPNTDGSQGSSKSEDEFPYFSSQSIHVMNQISTAMILAGYEAECCTVYGGLRLKALDVEFSKQCYENINVEDIQKMSWESLEGEINNWIHIMKFCTTNLFPAERNLCDSVFSDNRLTAQRLFCDLATSLSIRLLNFPNALVWPRRYSTEKLFKFLDIYEMLQDLANLNIGNDSSAEEFMSETSMAQRRIGGAVMSIFSQIESSIKNDNAGRTPVAGGAVHPLTRYTMNYLKYACEYKDTLEQVFQNQEKVQGSPRQKVVEQESKDVTEDDDRCPPLSPFALKLMMVIDLLDANIEMKSKLYRNPALRLVFLMNNGRYILQKIKESAEIYEMMGPYWSRKRTSELRRYHKTYQRETWSNVLQCISHEGVQVNGKVSKPILKERFKNFNSIFDEILKTQSSWIVSDGKLRSELRVSISSVVIPAYRSFLGRFKSYLDNNKQAGKYIKYQPEDIEELIEQLFEGNTASMAPRR